MIEVAFRQLVLASAGVGMVAGAAIAVRALARQDVVLRYRMMRALLVVAVLMIPLQLVAPRVLAGWGVGGEKIVTRAAAPVQWVLWLGGGGSTTDVDNPPVADRLDSAVAYRQAASPVRFSRIVAGLGAWGSTVVIAMYAAGVAVALGLLIVRAARTRRLLAVCRAVDDPMALAIWSEACAKAGSPARTRLLECHGLPAPACFGWVRETVLIPVESSIRPDSLRCAMLHELIHLRRRDPAWVSLQRALGTVFWFHPLVWVFSRVLDRDRELSCDAMVVRMLGKPRTYANALLDYCGRREAGAAMPVASALAGFGSVVNLKRRIEMIPNAFKLAGRGRMVVVVAGVAVAAALASVTQAGLSVAVADRADDAASASKAAPEKTFEVRYVPATAGTQKMEVEAPLEPTRSDRVLQTLDIMRRLGRPELQLETNFRRLSGSLTEQETIISLHRALGVSEQVAAADGSKSATLQATELIMNLPEGSALKAVFEGAQVEVKQDGAASEIVVRQGSVKIVDEQGVTRIVLKTVDVTASLLLKATMENDEVSFKAAATDVNGQPAQLQADIDLKPAAKQEAKAANTLETRWELLKPAALDAGPVRLKMQWVHDMAKLAELATVKEPAGENPK